MVVIRLARHGAHKAPFYRIVVADQRKKRDGRIIEQVGTYDPAGDPSVIDLDVAKVDEWIAKGAQPSDRVAKIIASVKNEPLPENGLYSNAMAGTDRMELYSTVNAAGDQMMLVSLFDNLGKGASGAAVQNLNIMMGVDENYGL